MSTTSKWLVGGAIVGVAAGAAAVASSQRARETVGDKASTSSSNVRQFVTAVRDNQEEIKEHMQDSGSKISEVADRASEDLKELIEVGKRLRGHADDMMQVINGMNREWRKLIDEISSEPDRLDQGDVELEHLPDPETASTDPSENK
ncbi:hypothetical protein [Alkalicoccus urumqiensis]|uniref:YtxH domain-containing protein n=1 Tax=Alkalicoccus urumqiensis TaxID=1548213 RepID=A0A2P6MGL2_ALKUR|nr:hypothetical protein [Alkalicoccus urumqiensis]PRO65428.1 hypothetical protein C6I21_09725 [Alkalicoccus urumqiensis]